MQELPISTVTTITQKGQVTIPLLIRNKLGIRAGDKIAFELNRESVSLKPVKQSLKTIFGSIPPLKKKLSIQQMRKIALEEKFHAVR